jgi:hypothetical protein
MHYLRCVNKVYMILSNEKTEGLLMKTLSTSVNANTLLFIIASMLVVNLASNAILT